MKSVYLYDSSLRLLKAIERCGFLNIHTLATQSHYVDDQEIIKKEQPFLQNTFFLHNSAEVDFPAEELSLDYDVIKKFRSTQYKVEQYLARFDIEQYMTQYIYYQILSFFYKRFKNKEIDAVFTVLPLHGSPLEIIPIDMALFFNKPVYTFDKLYANPDGYVLWGIWDYTKMEYVKLDRFNISPDLESYLYYKTKREYIPSGKALYKPSISDLSFFKKALKVITSLFINKDNRKKKAIINSFMGQYPLLGFFYLKYFNYYFRNNYKTHKKTVNYYRKKSYKADLGINYIYYPLHLDPEASTLVREELSNQLTIIKIISDNLPSGYKLYIKEHPVVFSFLKKKNLKQNWYFFLSMKKYRSIPFYKEIEKLLNVKMIKINESSEKLVKNSKAVVTINGTVSLEAAIEKKPVLLFGDKLPLAMVDNIFKISSTKDCIQALNTIVKGFTPDYQINRIKDYLFELHIRADAIKNNLFDINSDINKKLSVMIQALLNK